MPPQVFVAGYGIVSAIGADSAQTLEALKAGHSGIGAMRHLTTVHRHLPVGEVTLSDSEMEAALGVDPASGVSRCALLGMTALGEALAMAGLTGADLPGCAFVSGTTVGGMDKSELHYRDFFTPRSRREYIKGHDCGSTTEMIAERFGEFGFLTTISTACSSAANAIMLGARMITAGQADVVVAGGAESLTRYHLNGFNSLMILDGEPCRPFDAGRAGLNLGEGAAFLVLMSPDALQRRGLQPLCALTGWGNACDAFHQTASSPGGDGAYDSMRAALDKAGLSPADIDYVNAHGTGTPNNDASESTALARLFGSGMPPVSSTKSATGHTTSASGSIEAVISILALRHGIIPANLRFAEAFEGGITPETAPRQGRLRNVLCNSFGFGGNDTSLVFSAIPSDN